MISYDVVFYNKKCKHLDKVIAIFTNNAPHMYFYINLLCALAEFSVSLFWCSTLCSIAHSAGPEHYTELIQNEIYIHSSDDKSRYVALEQYMEQI